MAVIYIIIGYINTLHREFSRCPIIKIHDVISLKFTIDKPFFSL